MIKRAEKIHKKEIKTYGLCEACKVFAVQWILSSCKSNKSFKICTNCLSPLVTKTLSKKQFFNLLENGHTTSEYFLEDDFYDEKGNYLKEKD